MWSTTTALSTRICNLPIDDFVTLVNTAFINPVEDVQYLTSQIGPDGTPQTDFKSESEWGRQRSIESGDVRSMFPPTVIGLVEGSRASFPLRMRNSVTYVDDRIALIGWVSMIVGGRLTAGLLI